MTEQSGITPPYIDKKGRKPLRCCQCGVDLPESARVEWGWTLGNSMKFCTYGCMRTKQADIHAKHLETLERKKAEKESKKAMKQDNAKKVAMTNAEEAKANIPEDAGNITEHAQNITEYHETEQTESSKKDMERAFATGVLMATNEPLGKLFGNEKTLCAVRKIHTDIACLASYIKGARMFNMCFSDEDCKQVIDSLLTDIVERVAKIECDVEQILTGGNTNENTSGYIP